ncbi:MAG TPA: FAD:protein FMN transferase [Gammaproteobacteria bacterium]|nr:FAD:protein FMN transferase [Gammaproteobacteria bacterium]
MLTITIDGTFEVGGFWFMRRGALTRLLLAVLLSVAVIAVARLRLVPVPSQSGEYQVFGTVVRVDIRSWHEAAATTALADIGRLLARNHQAWHAWEPDSELSRLNARLAAGESGRVSADLAAMIRHAQEGYARSGGLFNAAMGKLIGSWGFHGSHYPLQTPGPAADELAEQLTRLPTMADVQVSGDDVVSSTNPRVALDLNGLAEGYAAQQIAGLLRSRGIDHALIYLGGYVMALGRAEGRPWLVGVRAPEGGLLGRVALQDGEVLSSSGDYQRYRASAAGREGHIVDPRRGRPQRATAATSVLSDDPVMADMAATALMVAGPAGFEQTARRMGMGCALLVARDGTIHLTPAMRARLELEQGLPEPRITAPVAPDCRRPQVD